MIVLLLFFFFFPAVFVVQEFFSFNCLTPNPPNHNGPSLMSIVGLLPFEPYDKRFSSLDENKKML